MPNYLLSVHTSADAPSDQESPQDPGPEEMQARLTRMVELETDMQDSNTWVFGGRLTEPDVATVVRRDSGKPVTIDGPFAEAKEHLAGFYIIQADDLDEALAWADRVTDCVGAPIEVRPFAGTGDLQSQLESQA